MLIDYTPAGHTVFATEPIDWNVWLIIVPFAIGMLVLEEAGKALCRSRFMPGVFGGSSRPTGGMLGSK